MIGLILSIVILFCALVIGVPVPFSFLLTIVFLVFSNNYDPSFLIPYGFGKMDNLLLLAIPLFILAGAFIDRGNIGSKLIDLIELFVGRVKGGLGAVVVIASALFGSITGSAAATLSSVGSIMTPRLVKAGFSRGFSAALLANSSVLGLLIPPSTLMILYAWVGNQSVLAAFLATVAPGLLLMVLLIFLNFFYNYNNSEIVVREKADSFSTFIKDVGKKSLVATPALTMPLLILGGIYGGIMTPTEAAAVSALYAIPLGFFVYKGLNKGNFFKIIIDSAVTTGVIMIMLYAIMMLSRIYVTEDIPTYLLSGLQSVSENRYIILLMINLFMILIGMLMDDTSAVLLSTPILLPIAMMLEVNPIQFAAIVGVNIGMGNVTPPTAPLLFLGARVSKAKVNEMIKPTLVMITFAWLPTLLITTFIPEFSLFLPRLILGIE